MMVQAMRAEGHTPDLMTYNCLLAAHRKQGDCTAALAILDQMLLKGDKDAWQRGDVDEYTCTALMQVRESRH
jgi:pentatricopeptide repeat protein